MAARAPASNACAPGWRRPAAATAAAGVVIGVTGGRMALSTPLQCRPPLHTRMRTRMAAQAARCVMHAHVAPTAAVPAAAVPSAPTLPAGAAASAAAAPAAWDAAHAPQRASACIGAAWGSSRCMRRLSARPGTECAAMAAHSAAHKQPVAIEVPPRRWRPHVHCKPPQWGDSGRTVRRGSPTSQRHTQRSDAAGEQAGAARRHCVRAEADGGSSRGSGGTAADAAGSVPPSLAQQQQQQEQQQQQQQQKPQNQQQQQQSKQQREQQQQASLKARAVAERLVREHAQVFDLDKSGRLSEEEIAAGADAVLKYDLNGDGMLDRREINVVRRAISTGMFGVTEWEWKLSDLDGEQRWPALRRVLFGLLAASTLSQMARVDMAIGIIPIAAQMGWDQGTAGIVQSAFFQGFVLSQLPAGLLVNAVNARWLLLGGVVLWSAATVAAPLALAAGGASGALPALCATRFMVGVGQGCVDASIVDTISRWAPSEQRSRSSSQAFGGYNLGMVTGLMLGPCLVSLLGWPWLFYVFGGLGFVWAAWWAASVVPLPQPGKAPASAVAMAMPTAGAAGTFSTISSSDEEEDRARGGDGGSSSGGGAEGQGAAVAGAGRGSDAAAGAGVSNTSGAESVRVRHAKEPQWAQVPFAAMARNRAVQGLAISHFIYGWGIFSLSVWLPTYITQVLGLSLTSSALLALIPPLGGIAAGSAAASTIDVLTSRRHGWSLTAARRAAQVGCFVLPSACFLGAVLSSGWTSLCLIMLGQSFHGFAMVGIWSSHADISPQYGGFLASATSSCASAAGAASVSAVGGLYQATGSWNIALVGPLVALYLVGAWVWTTMVVNEPQDFSTGGAAPATA